MKTTILLLVITWPVFLSAQETQLYETVNFQNAVKQGTRSRDGKPGPKYWQNHADYNISVRLDTAAQRIFGKEEVLYYNESPDTLDRIVLRIYQNQRKKGAVRNLAMAPRDLHEGVMLDTISINGKGINLTFSDNFIVFTLEDSMNFFNGTNLNLFLNEKLLPGKSLSMKCEWNYPIATGADFRRTGHYKNNAWFIGYFYPQIAVYDDLEDFFGVKGWDLQLFHQGWQEFYNDFNNYDVTIDVPEGFYVWATGKLINPEQVYEASLLKKIREAKESDKIIHIIKEEDLDHNYITGNKWHFEANKVPDFAFGTAKGYLWDATKVQIGNRSIFVDVAYHPRSNFYPSVIDIARNTIYYASNTYPAIPYPWEHATTFNGMLSGGMEFPMIANNSVFPDTVITRYVTFHEIFHNYTPFMMGFNEKRYPFMDEGFTDYFSCRFLSDVYQTVYPARVPETKNRMDEYGYFAANDDSPMFLAYSNINFQNVYYQCYVKPSTAYKLFIDMVGKEIFLKAFHEFVKRWRGKHPTPYDFFYTMNNALDENYNWFWKAWFFDLGYPDLGLEVEKNNIIVKRVGVGSLPLPVKLIVEMQDGSIKTFERSMDIWNGGEKKITIEIEDFNNAKSIRLDTESVPDIDYSNNYIKMN